MNRKNVEQSGEFHAPDQSGRNFEKRIISFYELMIELKLPEIWPLIHHIRLELVETTPHSEYDFMVAMAKRQAFWDLREMIQKNEISLPHTLEQLNRILARGNWEKFVSAYNKQEQASLSEIMLIHSQPDASKEEKERVTDEASRKTIDLSKLYGRSIRGSEILHEIKEFMEALESDFQSIFFLELEGDEVKYYKGIEGFAFDAATIAKFNVEKDADEATKCFALMRYTACVFHTMRVIECLVQRIGTEYFSQAVEVIKYGKPIPLADANWDEILTAITNELGKHTKAGESARDTRMRQICVSLDSIRGIWRNPTAHPRYHYTKEESRSIFGLSKEIAKQIADLI